MLGVLPDRAHAWDLPPAEAVQLQQRLRSLVVLAPPSGPFETVGGCDVSYDAQLGLYFAAVLVFRIQTLELVDRAELSGTVDYPYVPGLLSFREAPILLATLERLSVEPDVLMVDGQGIAHPRRLGLASHLGVLLDRPAVGCAKSLLVGRHRELGPERGSESPLVDRGETVGVALRTRTGVRPVYVSPGHRMDLPSSARLVLDCCRRTRLPEPTRLADHAVGEARRRHRATLDAAADDSAAG